MSSAATCVWVVAVIVISRKCLLRAETVFCNGDCSCPSSAPTPGAPCVLNCNFQDACKQSTLRCRPGDACLVYCNGKASCGDGTQIIANGATDVMVACNGEDACKTRTSLQCGSGACSIQCGDNTSCEDMGAFDFVTYDTRSFACSGICPSIMPDAFSPFPTSSPTIATLTPTSAPTDSTLSPTSAPTDAPTETPTASPTGSPTFSPTHAPILSPTSAPTLTPTLTPTMTPTGAPTNAPTGTPSAAPTLAPTLTPTFAPVVSPTSTPTSATSNPTMPPTAAPHAMTAPQSVFGVNTTSSNSGTYIAVIIVLLLMMCALGGVLLFVLYRKYNEEVKVNTSHSIIQGISHKARRMPKSGSISKKTLRQVHHQKKPTTATTPGHSCDDSNSGRSKVDTGSAQSSDMSTTLTDPDWTEKCFAKTPMQLTATAAAAPRKHQPVSAHSAAAFKAFTTIDMPSIIKSDVLDDMASVGTDVHVKITPHPGYGDGDEAATYRSERAEFNQNRLNWFRRQQQQQQVQQQKREGKLVAKQTVQTPLHTGNFKAKPKPLKPGIYKATAATGQPLPFPKPPVRALPLPPKSFPSYEAHHHQRSIPSTFSDVQFSPYFKKYLQRLDKADGDVATTQLPPPPPPASRAVPPLRVVITEADRQRLSPSAHVQASSAGKKASAQYLSAHVGHKRAWTANTCVSALSEVTASTAHTRVTKHSRDASSDSHDIGLDAETTSTIASTNDMDENEHENRFHARVESVADMLQNMNMDGNYDLTTNDMDILKDMLEEDPMSELYKMRCSSMGSKHHE